ADRDRVVRPAFGIPARHVGHRDLHAGVSVTVRLWLENGDRGHFINDGCTGQGPAVAEHLARVYELPIPAWTETHGNELHEPFFAGGLQSLKDILVVESPIAFRRRLLFVSKDALSRPRT